MRPQQIFAAAATAVLLAGCSSGMQVQHDWNQSVDFSAYETFAWFQESEERPSSQLLIANRIVAAVESDLQAKGLRLVTSDPDLLVGWDAATEGKMSATTYGTSYGGGYRGRYGGGMRSGYSTTTVDEWTEGTLIIEIVDVQRDELVYRSSAQAKLNEDASPEKRTENVNQAVARILEKFPPQQ